MPSQPEEKFPKRARLKRRSEFLNVSRAGKKTFAPHFIIIGKINDQGESRLGITVSAKVGKAVIRNRIKRQLREFFRRHRREIRLHQDIIIIARRGAEKLSSQELTREIREALIHSRSR